MSAFKHLQAICGQYLLSTSTKLEFGNFFQKNREIDGRTSLHRFTNFLPFFRGTFRMERDDGYSFDCRIPPFSLESKGDDPNDPAIVGN